jgi:hypothetical protein
MRRLGGTHATSDSVLIYVSKLFASSAEHIPSISFALVDAELKLGGGRDEAIWSCSTLMGNEADPAVETGH